MRVAVKLFAVAKEIAQSESIEVDVPADARILDLRRAITQQTPALADVIRHALFAVDTQYANDQTKLSAHAEVACIPPVSGG